MRFQFYVVMVMLHLMTAGCHSQRPDATASGEPRVPTSADPASAMNQDAETWKNTSQQWRELLTPEQFHVTRQKGTEPSFSGEYVNFKKKGTYRCVCCDAGLFSSDAKYDSESGWPSFWQPLDDHTVATAEDGNLFMRRVEVLCRRCEAHLGHVFEDGPPPTGLRYCINSVALKFADEKESK